MALDPRLTRPRERFRFSDHSCHKGAISMNHHSRFYPIAALLALAVLFAAGLRLPAAIPRAAAAPAHSTLAAPALTTSSAPAAAASSWTFQGPAPELNGQMNLVNVATSQGQVSGA